jgi:hypothetical protein
MRSRSFLPILFLAVTALAVPAQAQGLFLTPVPNAPFSAVVNVERSTVRPDGVVQQFKSVREIGRDSIGHIHNESRDMVPVSSDKTPEVRYIHLYDPQTRISTEINVRRRTFWTRTMNHPPSTVPPSVRFASPDNNVPPNEFARQEDLGFQDIEGVHAHGIRETQTVPADGADTGKEITVTDEYWYSDDLRINLIVKHNDPRTGSWSLTVTQIKRTEPDAAFLQIPAGYKQVGRGEE